jgi:hypothetical protein
MRLPADKIKQAILHPDADVRDAAVFYFARSYSPDPTIMPLAIQAFEQYGLDAFEILTFLQGLVQTDDTVDWLVREIERVGPGQDDREAGYRDALVAALRHADPGVLKSHGAKIKAMQQLDASSKDVIADRIHVSSFSADGLWRELTDFCDAQDLEDVDVSDEDYEFVCSVVRALSRYPDQVADRTLAMLDAPGEYGDWLEQMAVRLAGEIQLDAAIPHLLDRLEDCGSWLYEEAQQALAKIGNDAVIEEIAQRYPDADLDFQFAAASMLEELHTDLSVQTCLELLDQEDEAELRGSLLQSILMNFSPAGIEPARQHVLSTPKSLQMLEVRSALLVASKLMGETFPEFDAWLEDSQHDVEFRRQWFKDNPLDLDDFMGELKEEVFDDNCYLDDFDADDDADDIDSEPVPLDTIVTGGSHIGRNDACPCGSGKKYKKCCWGKARHFESN